MLLLLVNDGGRGEGRTREMSGIPQQRHRRIGIPLQTYYHDGIVRHARPCLIFMDDVPLRHSNAHVGC